MAQPPEAPNTRHTGPLRMARVAPVRGSAGLATLEWLLVIAAAGGFAAAMAVGFGGLIDDARTVGDDADTGLIDAGIAAARISDDAVAALIALEHASGDPDQSAAAQTRLAALAQRCRSLASAYPDAVTSADWERLTVPVEVPPPTEAAVPGTEPPTTDAGPQTTRTPPDDDTDMPVLTSGRWVCRIGHRP
ncbi:MAG: hypothetical protein F4070_09695 [Acidimicrobiales bacterium]|nr:hypothetical protein [Acidimicrobiales bacterium]